MQMNSIANDANKHNEDQRYCRHDAFLCANDIVTHPVLNAGSRVGRSCRVLNAGSRVCNK